MRSSAIRGAAAIAVAVALGCGSSPSVASADHGPPPPTDRSSAAAPRPVVAIKGCSTSPWRYASTSRGERRLSQFGPTQANRNRTGKTASVTLTSQVGGTVTATFSGATNVKGSVKLAEISGQFGISAQLSATASVGNSITFSVPSGKTGYGRYGVWSLPVRGKESRIIAPTCTVQTRATMTTAPFRVGWDVSVR